MRQSESIIELAEAMCAAQAEMGGAVKDSANPFFHSKYADLTSVVKAIKEPFAKNGLSYVQFPYSREAGVGVTTRLMHSSGQWLESEFVLPLGTDKDKNIKRDPQAAGAAITYARRYALAAMAGIPTADDDAESAMLRTSEDDLTDVIAGIADCGSLKALQGILRAKWTQYPKSREFLTEAYNKRKEELAND